jgi:hypothetical protein
VKVYKWFFVVLTLAQLVFTLAWLLLLRHIDRVIILSFLIYIGAILIGYISYEVERYRRRKKELLDNLP